MSEPGQVTYVVAYFLTAGILLVAGYFLHFEFVATVIVGLLIGRKIGWWLSKAFLYGGPLLLAILICGAWGSAIAVALDYVIRTLHPGTIAKVFAYGAGAYTSIPNFGLVPLHSDFDGLVRVK